MEQQYLHHRSVVKREEMRYCMCQAQCLAHGEPYRVAYFISIRITHTDLIPKSESPWEFVEDLEPQAPTPRDSDLGPGKCF